MTTASGCSISWPGIWPVTTSGTTASPVASAVIRIGDSRSRAPRRTSSGTEALALVPLQVLEVVDHQDAVARGDPHHGEEAHQRPERDDAAAEVRRWFSAHCS
jgi:hypothetical protein